MPESSLKMKRILLISGVLILLISCVNTRKLMENHKTDRIYFGRRGGFTNIPEEYVLFEKGQVCKMQNDSLLRIQKIGSKQIKTIDSLLTGMNFKELILNDPGNITYFIKVVKQDYENELMWSDAVSDDTVSVLYKTLLSTIKQ